MVQGLKFLSKKSFNPQNHVNRKQVYEAQQHNKLEEDRVRQREQQLRKEREDEELLAIRTGDGSQAQLRFMYDAPPGMKDSKKVKEGDSKSADGSIQGKSGSANESQASNNDRIFQVQPGDDAAAAAFRRMLTASNANDNQMQSLEGSSTKAASPQEETRLGFAPVLQGSTNEAAEFDRNNDSRSALEKAVGRKDRGAALTLEEQLVRFPQLKNAPMAKGMSTTDVNVSFKPLGAQLRNVKCLACGVWGHSRGDRECKMTGWDPFSGGIGTTSVVSNSIRPTERDQQTARIQSRARIDREDKSSDESSSSSSSDSSEERRRRRRKHRSKHKRRHSRDDSKKRKRRHRSESPSRKERSRKSHKKKSRRHE